MRLALARVRARPRRIAELGPVVSELLVGAQEEAASFHHAYVGTEHVLLVVLRGGEAAACALRRLGLGAEGVRTDIRRMVGEGLRAEQLLDPAALRSIGIDLDAVRERVDAVFGAGALDRAQQRRGGCGLSGVGVAPRLKRALEAARQAADAREADLDRVDVLLGIAAQQDSVAARILLEHGISRAALAGALAMEGVTRSEPTA